MPRKRNVQKFDLQDRLRQLPAGRRKVVKALLEARAATKVRLTDSQLSALMRQIRGGVE